MNIVNEIEKEYINYEQLPFQIGDLVKNATSEISRKLGFRE